MAKINDEKIFDYNKHNLIYISEYIKLADQKASILLTINIALIGFFFNYLKTEGFNENVIFKSFIISGLFLLITSSYIILIKIIWPRYNSNTNEYMSWGGIASFEDGHYYTRKLINRESDQFITDMAEQNYALAKICKTKYKFLKISMWFFSIGIFVVGISWFADK